MKQKSLLFTLLVFVFSLNSFGQINAQIKDVFKTFQEGYTKRDTALVGKFTTDLCTKDISILGTGDTEWFQGIAAAKGLFKNDWAYWMALSIDTTNIKMTTFENSAFFMVPATASITFPSKEVAYDFAIGQLQQSINNVKTNHNKLLAYSSEAADLIQKIESGGLEIKYSIRLAGGLVKQNGKWLFKQLIFSFPAPMIRK
jgi:hypothetical protein